MDAIKILLVEDEKFAKEIIARLLEPVVSRFPQGRVVIAATMAQALKEVALTPAPDVTILDLNLPDSTIAETLEHVRPMAARTPVFVLTGLEEHGTREKALASGASEFMVKNEAFTQPARFLAALFKTLFSFPKRLQQIDANIAAARHLVNNGTLHASEK